MTRGSFAGALGAEGGDHAWRIPLLRPSLPPLADYAALLADVWAAGILSNGGVQAARFEAAIADAAHVPAELVVATANCDLALVLTVRALDLPRGTPVLVPSFTFASTLNALLWNGLAPRFVDVDPVTFCLDPAAVAEALTDEVRLVVGTHAYGAACDGAALTAECERVGAHLLFDGAQAFATWVGDDHVSVLGDATAFSFSATKLATSGEGGAVITRDPQLAERLRVLRAYGRDGQTGRRAEVGLNAKLSELHAALGILSLGQLEVGVTRRSALVARYRAALVDLPGVRWQELPAAQRPGWTFLAVDLGEHRDAVEVALSAAGIETRRYFQPLHEVPAFADLDRAPLPVTERLGASILCLPLHADLAEADLDEVAAAVRLAVERAA